jgi:putative N6-adenine-specific DNA methylase
MRAAAVCAPGLEQVCADEVTGLGCRPRPAGPGTVEFDATTRQLYAANVWLRTATRVVVRLATFRATDFARLQDAAAEIDWGTWIGSGMAPRFRVTSRESRLYHTDAIAQRLHQVVGPPSLGEPEQLFVVRIDRNTVIISADASGEALHHRPWRTDLGDAPLRPTMAAALLLLARWDPDGGLIDPFCGSGTLPIEAALLATGRPPGGERSFAFHTWPRFETGTWASVAGEIASAERARPVSAGPLIGADRDAAMVARARANAERAGVDDLVELETRVVSHLRARPGPGLVATNPPYGKRMGEGSLDNLYRRFGAVLRERLPRWDAAAVAADRKLVMTADRRFAPLAPRFRHGGVPVRIYHRSGDPDPTPIETDPAAATTAVSGSGEVGEVSG